MISNLPPGIFTVEDIKYLINEFFDSRDEHKLFKEKFDNAIIKKINLTYNIH